MFFHDEYSALHILARVGHVETFQFVAERVDEVNPSDKYGRTPLAIAKKNKNFGIVQMIEDKLKKILIQSLTIAIVLELIYKTNCHF